MIIYCGLRHFYIHHLRHREDAYYILTYNKKVWDFSPELREHGFNTQGKQNTIFQLDKPVLTVPISFIDFWDNARDWHDFSREYTPELELEYPHSWYLRFRQRAVLEQFLIDFQTKAEQELRGGISGGGISKIMAKLAAHNLARKNRLILQIKPHLVLNKCP